MISEKNKSIINSIFLLIFTTFFIFNIVLPINASDSTPTRSIIGDLYNKTIGVNLSTGSLMDTQPQQDKRKDINTDILNGKAKKTYSLFDRFGGNIAFVPYYGEKNIQTNVLDNVYSRYAVKNTKGLTGSEIVKILTKPKMSSNNFTYKGRSEVLTDNDVKNGGLIDPRVSQFNNLNTGFDVGIGNFYLTVSKYMIFLTGYMSGPSLYNAINDVWQEAWKSGVADYIKAFMNYAFPFLGIIYILYLVIRSFQYARGKRTGKALVSYALTGILMGGIVASFMINPNKFSSLMTQIVTISDNAMNKTISSTGSEVVHSDDPTNAMTAALWEKAVFKPWSKGMFGSEYNHLYSAFAGKGKDSSGLALSNDKLTTKWNPKEERSNLQTTLGDPKIPLGNNKYTSNWAEYAWSTQSIYHISPYNLNDNKSKKKNLIWPIEAVTPYNNQIYLDDFRWVDALMNVGYVFKGGNDSKYKQQGYDKSRPYKEDFVNQGGFSLWVSILSIPILIQGFRKMKVSITLILAGLIFLYKSMRWFISPERGYDPISNIKSIIGDLGNYLWVSLVIYIQIILYITINMDAMGSIAWLFLSIYLLSLRKPQTIVENIVSAKKMGNKIKNSKQFQTVKSHVEESTIVNKFAKENARYMHSKDSSVNKKQAYKSIKKNFYNNKNK